jgi:hypothetical protein
MKGVRLGAATVAVLAVLGFGGRHALLRKINRRPQQALVLSLDLVLLNMSPSNFTERQLKRGSPLTLPTLTCDMLIASLSYLDIADILHVRMVRTIAYSYMLEADSAFEK